MKLKKLYLYLVMALAFVAVIIIVIAVISKGPAKIVGAQAVAGLDPKILPRLTAGDFAPLPGATSTDTNIPILMYHHIGYVPTSTADSIRIGLTVSPLEFSQQVAWLKKEGYNSISLNDLYLYSQKRFTLPKKPVIFTFDDGYSDAFSNAVPILKAAGYSGTFGIITNFPGTVSGSNTYATWEAIAAAKQAGMEIVCHTQNHFDGSNPTFTADYIYQNFSGCQQALQSHLGAAEPYLIYPYGHFTAVYLQQMRKVGFVMGLTVHEGAWLNLKSLTDLPRVRVNPNEPLSKFIEKLTE